LVSLCVMNGDARGFGRCQSQTPVWGPKDTSAPQHPVIITPHGDVKQHVYFPRSPLLFLSKIYTSSHLLNSVPVTMKFLTLTTVLAVAITLTFASPFPNREKYANAISIVDRKPLLPNHPSPSISLSTFLSLEHANSPYLTSRRRQEELGAKIRALRKPHEAESLLPSRKDLHGQYARLG
jgi:hypothetical protein